jgi:putative methyltransferase (TIGR04325 family)
VVFTSGTLQLVEEPFAGLLAQLGKKPRHLLINRVPITNRPTYYTIADQVTSCCAYRIANRAEFVNSFRQLGYSLIDSWHCYELSCRILFHPTRSLRPYSGMYLRLAS